LQMSWAGHESQHAIDDLAEPCFVCVQLDSSGSLPPTLVLSSVEPAHQIITSWQWSAPVGDFRFNAHAPRAPPRI